MRANSKSLAAGRLMVLLAVAGILCLTPLCAAHGQNPASGTLHATDTAPLAWTGTHVAPGVVISESDCVDGVNCETFTLTVAGTQSDWAGRRVQILLTWQNSANEYDIYIHQGTSSGKLVTSAIQGPGLT